MPRPWNDPKPAVTLSRTVTDGVTGRAADFMDPVDYEVALVELGDRAARALRDESHRRPKGSRT